MNNLGFNIFKNTSESTENEKQIFGKKFAILLYKIMIKLYNFYVDQDENSKYVTVYEDLSSHINFELIN